MRPLYEIVDRNGRQLTTAHTASSAVWEANEITGLRPEELDPPHTTDDFARLLERDGYWHAGEGILVRRLDRVS